MIVGCYSMDLYCDHPHHDRRRKLGSRDAEYIGETYGECAKQARHDGWILARDRSKATCPKCSGKRKKEAR